MSMHALTRSDYDLGEKQPFTYPKTPRLRAEKSLPKLEAEAPPRSRGMAPAPLHTRSKPPARRVARARTAPPSTRRPDDNMATRGRGDEFTRGYPPKNEIKNVIIQQNWRACDVSDTIAERNRRW